MASLLLVGLLKLIDHLWDIEEVVDGLPRSLLETLPLHVVLGPAILVEPLIEDALDNIQDFYLVFAHDYHSLAGLPIHPSLYENETHQHANHPITIHRPRDIIIMEPEDNHPRR